jgi:hypothetical protein
LSIIGELTAVGSKMMSFFLETGRKDVEVGNKTDGQMPIFFFLKGLQPVN